ncbi:MAG: RNA methyltransferase [Muribaculaceae bacterium]
MEKKSMLELHRVNCEEYKNVSKIPLVIVLDDIRSLNNIGSIFRTADAFVIDHIYLCGITATPPHPDIHKTALGAEESVTWSYEKSIITIIKELKDKDYKICAIEQVKGSISLEQFRVNSETKYAIIFGNEVKGVQQQVVDVCDCCIEIPQCGTKHSLNVSISAGVVMWELFKQFNNVL